MTIPMPPSSDLEVNLKSDPVKAIIEGKTTVSFQSLVTLILQKKVFTLFKDWSSEPIILSSSLLTSLAASPQDSQENRSHLILVTLGVGILGGIAFYSLILVLLSFGGLSIGNTELLLVAGCILGGGALMIMLSRMQVKANTEKVTEALEKVANLLK